jgi:putative ABC transport system permease protein
LKAIPTVRDVSIGDYLPVQLDGAKEMGIFFGPKEKKILNWEKAGNSGISTKATSLHLD